MLAHVSRASRDSNANAAAYLWVMTGAVFRPVARP